MQWSDVIKAPPAKMLRQFAGLWLVVFGGFAAWRAFHGQVDAWTYGLGIGAVVVGGIGLIWPMAVRPIYSGWMIAAFPIGWTISKIALGAMFYVMFTFVALVFKVMGRDVLHLKRRQPASYWVQKTGNRAGQDYLRQF